MIARAVASIITAGGSASSGRELRGVTTERKNWRCLPYIRAKRRRSYSWERP